MAYNTTILTNLTTDGLSGLVLALNILSNQVLAVTTLITIVLIMFISGLISGYKIQKSATAAFFIGFMVSVLFRLWSDSVGNQMLGSIWVISMAILFGISLVVTISLRE